jgi:hypothetical protein
LHVLSCPPVKTEYFYFLYLCHRLFVHLIRPVPKCSNTAAINYAFQASCLMLVQDPLPLGLAWCDRKPRRGEASQAKPSLVPLLQCNSTMPCHAYWCWFALLYLQRRLDLSWRATAFSVPLHPSIQAPAQVAAANTTPCTYQKQKQEQK